MRRSVESYISITQREKDYVVSIKTDAFTLTFTSTNKPQVTSYVKEKRKP